MKKLVFIFSFLTALSFAGVVQAQVRDVAIDAKHYPNPIFRKCVQENFDTNKDGVLSRSEADAVKWIYVKKYDYALDSEKELHYLTRSENIYSLKGIEYFSELTELYCSGNQLTTLDVSKNTKLEKLDCWGNQLTTLDLSKNTKLEFLWCDTNLEVIGYSGYRNRI